MRTPVADVGSNSTRVVVADSVPGIVPQPVAWARSRLRQAELSAADGSLNPRVVDRLVMSLRCAADEAAAYGADEVFAYATAAVRDAPDQDAVVDAVRSATGLTLTVLDGAHAAQLTFLAARSRFGWSAGALAVVDSGGGSLELAYGMG